MKKEELLNFYQAYRLYVFPAIIVLSSLILITLVIYPQTIKLINNQKVEGEIFNRAQLLEVKAQTLESYDSVDLEKKVDFALGFYPAEKDFVSALGLLQNVASQAGFNIISITVGGGSSKIVDIQNYNIKMEVIGSSRQLSTLLNNIENSPRLMRVSSAETTIGKDDKGYTSLTIDVLYSSAPQKPGSIDSPLPELSNKDEEVIVKLSQVGTQEKFRFSTSSLGPRGKENPFE